MCNHHHHHHIVLAARISLTLSRHSSLSFIALGRSSGQQPVIAAECTFVLVVLLLRGRVWGSIRVQSSSLLLQQCPACLVRLNAACNPILAATPHKTPTVRPPAPYHEIYSSSIFFQCATDQYYICAILLFYLSYKYFSVVLYHSM